jgi:hypothetical protein
MIDYNNMQLDNNGIVLMPHYIIKPKDKYWENIKKHTK